ncbi:MBL fold metallo-hydrolase [Azospirillum sp. TSO22-1]|uniref:MBL fold metallo-hydrolase n=1 Tax=Azospirillum sp. TSO22-1 TaxID=716789 RepID=UPI000D6142E6|nr:MBL fold metallo-hydrolase [Azospirillum sp. TSO22-1]PWC44922.1 beta-lactamase [Azospirillum sp. TSO22-1]
MIRRRFLTGAALAAAAVPAARLVDWQSLSALAAEVEAFVKGPPVKDQPVTRVSPHVYVIQSPDGFPTPENQGMMANVTFVVGAKGVMVVDSGASLQIGEMAIRQLRTVTDKPVVGVVNTHYHGDHWLGNHAFVDAYGMDLPRYALPHTREAIQGVHGSVWLTSMVKWTAQASAGTRIVPPNRDVAHGDTLSLGDVTLRLHHYGRAHTPSDVSVEVVEDGVMCVGDILMDRRIANMDDGSYTGTFQTMDALKANSATKMWLPAHGVPGPEVIVWQRELFEGIYETCAAAVKAGRTVEEAKPAVLRDPRVAARAAETKGWDSNIGKYISLAYLEAEQSDF